MIIIPYSESLVLHALHLCKEIAERYRHNKDSIKQGEGHLEAKIVELVLLDHFDVTHTDTYHHDVMVHARDGKDYLVDIKAKLRKDPPKMHYLASVSMANIRQNCDYYLFASLTKDNVCCLMGYYPAEAYRTDSTFARKGEIDTSDPRGFEFKADCRNMPYSQLIQLNEEYQ